MRNYICINGLQIELTDEQAELIKASFNVPGVILSDVAVEDTIKIGEHELIVLEHFEDGTTALIRKDLLPDKTAFGKSNNYDGSYVDAACNEFAEKLAAIVGAENIVERTVDLTTNDGLDDYGQVQRRASLLTADRYRRYVKILDKFKVANWWWLATGSSTTTHENNRCILCVSPSGGVDDYNDCLSGDSGVRPFCILKSNIFVSK